MSGRFVDIAVVEDDPYVFYAASATGGVFKTSNNGVTFEPVFENEGTHSVGDIAVHQANPNIVWIGTGERANRQSSSWGDGVYKSTDAGESWTNLGLRDSRHIGRIVLHPTDEDVVYVAAMGHLWGNNEERGLYKSEDGGLSWSKVLHIDDMTGVVDVAMDPEDPDTLYAAAYQRQRKPFGFHGGGPGSGLYKSTDGGASWKELRNGLPDGDYGRIGISVYRKDPRIVYVCIEQGLRYTASTSYEERLAGIYRSEDRGESFVHMSDWNPRPMYASQILVDPSDDRRIYMENAFSFSDDGGKTFTVPKQSVHSDDRYVWVNPRDSRHLIKASDGALAISYDRGATWLFVASLPVSQYYRVRVDMQRPFNVYGGLQDNGSWRGPSATYRSEGILNEDWIRIGGGDGFLNEVDPSEPHTVFAESQYLGLTRVDLRNNEKQQIRPGNTTGWIESRRNWDVWGTGEDFPFLGEELTPANWDGPFLVSPHNPSTVYAGTNELWKTTNQGQSWVSLGNLTTGVVRSELSIMGQTPTERTPSLDDGIPFYPTTTAIAESPLREGLLYVGTDDGNLARSQDGGLSWEQVGDRLPGAPASAWISGIEPSRFDEDTVYVVVNNYRNDDYRNFLYKSTDAGRSWSSIVGDLPAERVLRTLREDPRNPNLLYVGAEIGLYLTIGGGLHWVELENNLPTLAHNDLVVHPRDNDLVLGTHGRGIWILDNVNALQEMNSEVLASEAHLFTIEPAEMTRYVREKAEAGDMVFKGENPPAGAIIDYYLGRELPADAIALAVVDAHGNEVRSLEPERSPGINRIVWNLRHDKLPDPLGEEPDDFGEMPKGPEGPWVVPGEYSVRLTAADRTYERRFRVDEDPRIAVARAERHSWTRTLLGLGDDYRTVNGWMKQLESQEAEDVDKTRKLVRELRRRIQNLYQQIIGWTGAPTEDQRAQIQFLRDAMTQLEPEVQAVSSTGMGR
ncbi:MAG TPA: hypothetical protein VLK65_11470 [Vicinamibacteria bacterium]|nr:hypothetical protein [Vicinamibacteria bacterium]